MRLILISLAVVLSACSTAPKSTVTADVQELQAQVAWLKTKVSNLEDTDRTAVAPPHSVFDDAAAGAIPAGSALSAYAEQPPAVTVPPIMVQVCEGTAQSQPELDACIGRAWKASVPQN